MVWIYDLIFYFRVNGRISRVATVEATAFSIGLNNLMFLSLMVLCAFFVFTRLEPVLYVLILFNFAFISV